MRRKLTLMQKVQIAYTLGGAGLIASIWLSYDITNTWLAGAHSLAYSASLAIALCSAGALASATTIVSMGHVAIKEVAAAGNWCHAIMFALATNFHEIARMAIGVPFDTEKLMPSLAVWTIGIGFAVFGWLKGRPRSA